MDARFNWRHMPAALGALAFGAVSARDQLAIEPALVIVPAMLGLAVGVIGRALSAGVSAFFFAVFAATLCWHDGMFLFHLPTVLLAQGGGVVLGRGLVGRARRERHAPRPAPAPTT